MTSEHNRLLGLAVRDARARAQLSQHKLATMMGVSQSQISRMETGENAWDCGQLIKACAALGIDAGAILRQVAGAPLGAQLPGRVEAASAA
jgi:transcriptional regulator with XRE-family HTH domain